ncbi:unnamed protein product [Soboliphyme baturini]|uniref:Ig-like domain-containing protein n=1 Tax=Soboliphyme baturini TaxID=241478 RepID=A0A183IR20_9BILA|nr:unnamed protein product [Soboliphyme baturini]
MTTPHSAITYRWEQNSGRLRLQVRQATKAVRSYDTIATSTEGHSGFAVLEVSRCNGTRHGNGKGDRGCAYISHACWWLPRWHDHHTVYRFVIECVIHRLNEDMVEVKLPPRPTDPLCLIIGNNLVMMCARSEESSSGTTVSAN